MLFCLWVKASSIYKQLLEDKQAIMLSCMGVCAVFLNFKTKQIKAICLFIWERIIGHEWCLCAFLQGIPGVSLTALTRGHHIMYSSLIRFIVCYTILGDVYIAFSLEIPMKILKWLLSNLTKKI